MDHGQRLSEKNQPGDPACAQHQARNNQKPVARQQAKPDHSNRNARHRIGQRQRDHD